MCKVSVVYRVTRLDSIHFSCWTWVCVVKGHHHHQRAVVFFSTCAFTVLEYMIRNSMSVRQTGNNICRVERGGGRGEKSMSAVRSAVNCKYRVDNLIGQVHKP